MTAVAIRPSALEDGMLGAGLLAGGANVVMQLSWPEVGHAVVESTVAAGRLFDHPVKRTRTTLTYLAVAMAGSDEERMAYRRAVSTVHARVRSTGSSPVRYHALDPDLQLWVAACLYRGVADIHRTFGGELDDDAADRIYQRAAKLGTTLQVRADMWPADRDAFQEYWTGALARVSIDDTVRDHLLAVITLAYLPKPIQVLFGRFNAFVTAGFLPQRFRTEMRLPWTPRQQRRFDRLMTAIGMVARWMPKVVREFPFNVCLWDLRRRIRSGRPLV